MTVLTRHLCFGSLVVDGLAGEGVDSDLGDGYRSVLQLAVEPQDLGALTGVLHHLDRKHKINNISVQMVRSGDFFSQTGLQINRDCPKFYFQLSQT